MKNYLMILEGSSPRSIILTLYLLVVAVFFGLIQFHALNNTRVIGISVILISLFFESLTLSYVLRINQNAILPFLFRYTLLTLCTFGFTFILLPYLGIIDINKNPVLTITIGEVFVVIAEAFGLYLIVYQADGFWRSVTKVLLVSFLVNAASTFLAYLQYKVVIAIMT